MKKNIVRNGLVFGIIVLFVGASVIPSIGGIIKKGVDTSNSNVIGSAESQEILLDDPPNIEWSKTFGGTGYEEASSVKQTADGGYIIAGSTDSYGAGSYDVWLIKTNANGNKQWDKTFGGADDDAATSVQQTSDGGYIIAGGTWSYGVGGSCDVWLIKTNANGNKQWDKTFGGMDDEAAYEVQQTSDGGYIMTGWTIYGHINDEQKKDDKAIYCDCILIKTNANGNEQWYKTFKGSENTYNPGYSVQQTNDGGYIIAGSTDSYGAGSYDVWLIKTNANGNKQWDKTFGGSGGEEGLSVQQTNDGGYIIAGSTDSYGAGDSDIWLIKTNANGNKQWDKTFGGADIDGSGSVRQTVDGGYIILGGTYSYGAGDSDIWLIKTNANGNKQWDKTMGGPDFEETFFNTVEQTIDGGYIIACTSFSYGAGNGDLWLIKLEPEGGNQPPNKPHYWHGPSTVEIGESNTFSFVATDPDDDLICMRWDWGDGPITDWGPYYEWIPGYIWSVRDKSYEALGTYEIRVQVKDEHGLKSEWSDPLTVYVRYTGLYPGDIKESKCWAVKDNHVVSGESLAVEYKGWEWGDSSELWYYVFRCSLLYSRNQDYFDLWTNLDQIKFYIETNNECFVNLPHIRIGGHNVTLDENPDPNNEPFVQFALNVCSAAVDTLLGLPVTTLILNGGQLVSKLADAEIIEPDITWESIDWFVDDASGYLTVRIGTNPDNYHPGDWWTVAFNSAADCFYYLIMLDLSGNPYPYSVFGEGKIHFGGPVMPRPETVPPEVFIRVYCPVDVVVYIPNGLFISKNISSIEGANYSEVDLDGDGELDIEICIPHGWFGNYSIFVKPKPDADPNDTFSIYIGSEGQNITLVEDMKISDINTTEPYVFNKPQPPWQISITGSSSGLFDSEYELTCFATTPYDTDVYEYVIDWGAGSTTRWDGPFVSGENVTVDHKWKEPGVHVIKAKAMDMYGNVCNWSKSLEVDVKGYPSLIFGIIQNDSIVDGYHHFETGNLFFYLNLKPLFFKSYSSGEIVVVKELFGRIFLGNPGIIVGLFNGAVVSDI